MGEPRGALGLLRDFAKKRPPGERSSCELCSGDLGPEGSAQHEHQLDPARRALRCVCPGCGLATRESEGWRRVPSRVESLPDLRLGDLEWESLDIPIRMAFFVRGSRAGRVQAFYPSPAGATESALALDAWADLEAANPVLARLAPDVEALLVNRVGSAREHFRVSIDHCFRLVGLVRIHWRGFTGGAGLSAEIARFFAALASREVTGA